MLGHKKLSQKKREYSMNSSFQRVRKCFQTINLPFVIFESFASIDAVMYYYNGYNGRWL